MRQQVCWIYKNINSTNFSYPLVHDYLTRKMLTKAGVVFDQPSEWEIEAYHFIENVLESERRKEQKRK